MDPIANLRRQLQIAARIRALSDLPSPEGVSTEPVDTELALLAIELAELVEALHDWRLRGGFTPDATAL